MIKVNLTFVDKVSVHVVNVELEDWKYFNRHVIFINRSAKTTFMVEEKMEYFHVDSCMHAGIKYSIFNSSDFSYWLLIYFYRNISHHTTSGKIKHLPEFCVPP